MATRVVRALDLQYGSLGPGSALGEKGKKPAIEASRGVIWGEENHPSPLPRIPLYFSYLIPFFCLENEEVGTATLTLSVNFPFRPNRVVPSHSPEIKDTTQTRIIIFIANLL